MSAILLLATPARADRVKFCFFYCEIETDAPTDSFCQLYQPVISSKGDTTKGLPLALRKRIAGNEIKYKCQCQGWTNPICKSVSVP